MQNIVFRVFEWSWDEWCDEQKGKGQDEKSMCNKFNVMKHSYSAFMCF